VHESYLSLIVVTKENVTSAGKGVQAVHMLFVITLDMELNTFMTLKFEEFVCGKIQALRMLQVPLLCITLNVMWVLSTSQRYVEEKFSQHVSCPGTVIIIIIIIIIIWHYNPLCAFAFSAKSVQVLLSLAISFQFLTFSFLRSSVISSCHHCLGLPTGLVPMGFQSNSFVVGLAGPFFEYAPAI